MFKSDEARSMLRAVAFTVALVLVGLVVIGGFAYAASLSIAPVTNKVAKERAVTTPLVKDRLTAEFPRNKDYRATLPVRRPEGTAKTVVGVVVELPGRGIGIVQGVSFYPVIGDSGVKLKEYRYKVV